jgi:hypothetical protein
MSVVYFVRIGKHIKIGTTISLKGRLQSFRTSSAEEITVLLIIPGGREVERRLHDLFREERIRLEFFYSSLRIGGRTITAAAW